MELCWFLSRHKRCSGESAGFSADTGAKANARFMSQQLEVWSVQNMVSVLYYHKNERVQLRKEHLSENNNEESITE